MEMLLIEIAFTLFAAQNDGLNSKLRTLSNQDGDCNGNTNVPFVSELQFEKTLCFPFKFASLGSL